MIYSQKLLEMSQVKINEVDPSTLVDIDTIVIKHTLPHEDKVLSIIQQLRNPYCFMSGGVPVRVRFVGNGKKLSQSLINYFSLIKQK